MNIFILSTDPTKAAQLQCDKHVVKMILESFQMLSTAHHVNESANAGSMYKAAFKHHPCTKWAAESSGNYAWLLQHTKALLQEYSRRYGKIHASARLLPLAELNPCPVGKMTKFAQAMPDDLKNDDTVMAYRMYYKTKVAAFKMTWKGRPVPSFMAEVVACQ